MCVPCSSSSSEEIESSFDIVEELEPIVEEPEPPKREEIVEIVEEPEPPKREDIVVSFKEPENYPEMTPLTPKKAPTVPSVTVYLPPLKPKDPIPDSQVVYKEVKMK